MFWIVNFTVKWVLNNIFTTWEKSPSHLERRGDLVPPNGDWIIFTVIYLFFYTRKREYLAPASPLQLGGAGTNRTVSMLSYHPSRARTLSALCQECSHRGYQRSRRTLLSYIKNWWELINSKIKCPFILPSSGEGRSHSSGLSLGNTGLKPQLCGLLCFKLINARGFPSLHV